MEGVLEAIRAGGWPTMLIALVLITFSASSFAIILTEAKRQHRIRKDRPNFLQWLRDETATVDRHSVYGQYALGFERIPRNLDARIIERHVDHLTRGAIAKGANGMSFLASIGSNSPFVGLFGTVVGVKTALEKIGLGQVNSIRTLSLPVGEALIMTALGLAVALPAVFAYNHFSAVRKRLRKDLEIAHPHTLGRLTGRPLDPEAVIEQLNRK